MIGSTFADVTNAVQTEVDRIKNSKNKDTKDELVQSVQNQYIINNNNQIAMQWSTNSSDDSTAKKTDGNGSEDDLLANLTLANGNGDEHGDGYGPGGNDGYNDNGERGDKGNGYKRNEFIFVNPRNVTITLFFWA